MRRLTLDRGRVQVIVTAIILLGLLLRLRVLPAAGFATDVSTFEAWAERLASVGPRAFYEPGYFADYPPGFLYVLWLLGVLFDGEALRLAVKAVSIPFDVGIAVLVAWAAGRTLGRWGAVAAAAAWMLTPGPIVDGALWGQTDAIGTLPLIGLAVAIGARRWTTAGVLAGLAVMVKPQFGLGGLVLVVVVALELGAGRRRPLVALAAAAGTVIALGIPFAVGPLDLLGLVRDASASYPYTSLFAFNIWALLADFWKPDDPYVVVGAVLLVAGVAAAMLVLIRSRDQRAALLAIGLATMAFYFLPTRAHERYLFPAFGVLLPLALERRRALVPYLILGLAFSLTLVYALSRYPQNGTQVPGWVDQTIFSDGGIQLLIVVMLVSAAALVAGLLGASAPRPVTEEEGTVALAAVPVAALPAGLARGRRPMRRDLLLAFAFALAMLLTRGYRLEWPRDMYFDEVYHARTAYELLAEREPYEWTHPHLAKEIMALGILAFGDNRVIGQEPAPTSLSAFAISNDGVRAYATTDGAIVLRDRDGRTLSGGAQLAEPARALAFDDARLFALTASRVVEIPRSGEASLVAASSLPFSGAVALHVGSGRVATGGPAGITIQPAPGGDFTLARVPTVALTGRPDGAELYALDDAGAVHVIDGATGAERRLFATGPGTAIAFAEGPGRLFVASRDLPELVMVDLEGGQIEHIPLANDRTGTFASPITALAIVPRTQMLYAAADHRIVVVETHGASPFAAIAADGDRLGVDGTADTLVVAADGGAAVIETGRNAFAWRLPGVVLGAVLAFFAILLARRLFASPLVPLLTGFAILLDGSMFAQPRIGMNDIYVATFIVAGWYFVVAAHDPRRSARVDIVLAGVLMGLALAAKWVGAYAIAGTLVASLVVTARGVWRAQPGGGGPLDLLAGRGRNAAFLFACFAVIPVALYLLAYREWFGGPTVPYGWDLAELTRQMYQYHSGLTSTHPAGSPWWSWPLDLKPVYWYFGQGGGNNAYIYDAGNIVLFWMALPASIWLGVTAFRARSLRAAFPVFVLLTQLVAWIPITRVLFFYHFFTALPFYLIALAAWLATLWERGERALVIGVVAAAAIAGIFFYPFVSGQPVPAAQSSIYFVLPTWEYDCQFSPDDGSGFRCNLGSGGFDIPALLSRLALAAAFTALVASPILLLRLPRIREMLSRPPDP